MKRILLVLCTCFFITTSAYAQLVGGKPNYGYNSDNKMSLNNTHSDTYQKGWLLSIDAGLIGYGNYKEKFSYYDYGSYNYLDRYERDGGVYGDIHLNYGYRLSPVVYLGLGTGVSVIWDRDVYYDLYLDFRAHLPLKKCAPYIGARVGLYNALSLGVNIRDFCIEIIPIGCNVITDDDEFFAAVLSIHYQIPMRKIKNALDNSMYKY